MSVPLIVLGVILAFSLILLMCSFDTLEYTEMGLNYAWITEQIEDHVYTNGRYFLGLGHSFLTFPRTVQSIVFIDDMYSLSSATRAGPALSSRTSDGLMVLLEVSFQYKLKPDDLYKLYTTLGPGYRATLTRMAIEQITASATKFKAAEYFDDRTKIADKFHSELDSHFKDHAFSEVRFLQLRTVHLPTDFEESLRTTQIRTQDVLTAQQEQRAEIVGFETIVLQAKQHAKVIEIGAQAQARSVMVNNDAFCEQYRYTQELTAKGYKDIMSNAKWNRTFLLNYMRIRALRDHPSDKSIIMM